MRVGGADQLSARSLQAVLFDLDGTLLDTAADISLALNRALAEQRLTSLPEAQVRVLIGRGVPGLIERAVARLAAAGESADAGLLLERFHFHYERIHELDEIQTRVYPGVAAGHARLDFIEFMNPLVMEGDSLTDVLAARAAGLAVVCVPYGYNEGADPRALACDAFVESVGGLPALLTVADRPSA